MTHPDAPAALVARLRAKAKATRETAEQYDRQGDWVAAARQWGLSVAFTEDADDLEAALAALGVPPPPQVEQVGVVRCENFTPPSWTGHWRDWHRGHGCHLDPEARGITPPPAPHKDT